MGNIAQSGYTTITFNEDVNFTIGSAGGCGSGMHDLLNQLGDLRGGSTDIYIGVLPALSSIQTPGSNIGGCAPTGGGTAAVFIDQPTDVPHECGHALGRSHAPCAPGACNPMPANVDPHYPQYGTLPAGSIGAFGFDPTAHSVLNPTGYCVLNPADTFDTMAYRCPQWISAYTYLALAGASAPSEGGSSSPGLSAHVTTDVPIEMLFLRCTISRERVVRREVAFHFAAMPRYQKMCKEFTVELLDVDREVLLCMPLSCDCDDVIHNCWPRRFNTAVPYPAGSRWLLIYDNDRKIHEEWIPRPPKVEVELERSENGWLLKWKAKPEGDADEGGCCHMWYLPQWFDEDDKVWRGIVPRTRAEQNVLQKELIESAQSASLQIRVLASCGRATGIGTLHARREGDGRPPEIKLVYHEDGGAIGAAVSVVAVAAHGRHLRTSKEVWLADNKEIGKGSKFDLRRLKEGDSDLKVFVQTTGHVLYSKSWGIRRQGGRFTIVSEGEQRAVSVSREPHVHPHSHPHTKPKA